MNVLIIGSGGREHALAWKLSKSSSLENLYIAPGNGGTRFAGKNVDISPTDFEAIKTFSLQNNIDLIVVGPEQPLVEGIVDFFREDPEAKHIPVIGPSKQGALLEGSKDFANQFMKTHNIPTADFQTFTIETSGEAFKYLDKMNPPYVLKSDGLAGGKGVIITEDVEEAKHQLQDLLEGKFGEASKKVVIEQFLEGKELSVFVLTDGKNYKILPNAKDYKRIGEKDTGLNTGGMGAVSPVPYGDAEFMRKIEEQIIQPTIKGLHEENIDYKGFLYFGLIKVGEEPYVIEYNVRMGDPETQAVIPRINSDLLSLLASIPEERLDKEHIEIDSLATGCVVIASEGYPGKYEKGKTIHIGPVENAEVFHAGTATKDDLIVTSGGRVLSVVSKGNSYEEVFRKIYENVEKIDFEGKYYRKDIGFDL
ncbi:MAG: phosphoribosylamine--glycine ligase [Bacteroidota bacterium]